MSTRRRCSRRLLGLVALALIAVGAIYLYWTRPVVLRSALAAALAEYGVSIESIGHISYVPWRGVIVADAQLDVASLIAPAGSRQPPDQVRLWRVAHGEIRIPLVDVIRGDTRPRRIALRGVEIGLIARPIQAREGGPGRFEGYAFPDPQRLPEVRIRDAQVRVFVRDQDKLKLRRHLRVDLSGWTSTAEEGGAPTYRLTLLQTGGAGLGDKSLQASHQPLAVVSWTNATLSAQTGALELADLRPWLPRQVLDALNDAAFTGQFYVDALHLSDADSSVELVFNAAAFSIPVEPIARVPEAERFLRIDAADGRVRYSWSDRPAGIVARPVPQITAELTGRVRGAPLSISAKADGVRASGNGVAADGFEFLLVARHIDLPTAAQYPQFVNAARLPEGIRNVFEKYAPSGPVDFRLHASRRTPTDEVRFDGVMESLGGGCRYALFPYDVEDVRGVVRFSNDGVDLDGLRGRHGSARVRLDGHLNSSAWYTGFELVVRGENVPLDSDLYVALPAEYQQLWREAAPVGLADISAVVTRAEGSPEIGRHKPRIEIDTRLLAGSLGFEQRRLTHADGLIHVADGRIEITDLYGNIGDVDVHAWGRVAGKNGSAQRRMDIGIEAAGMELVRAESSMARQGLRFTGHGDVWGHLLTGDQGDSSRYIIRMLDGTLVGFDVSQPWTVDAGWIKRGRLRQAVIGLSATRGKSRVHLAGELPVTADAGAPMELVIRADQAEIDALLGALVPPRWLGFGRALGLSGMGSARVHFRQQPGANGRPRQTADIDLTAERMRPRPIPLALRKLHAQVHVDDAGFRIAEASASYGDSGRFALEGRGGWSETKPWSKLDIQASDIELTPEFVAALPGPLANLLKRMAVTGRLSTRLDRLRLETDGQGRWQAKGRIELADASLDLGLKLAKVAGELSGTCTITPDGRVRLEGGFAIDQGVLAGRPIEHWEGRLQKTADDPHVAIDKVRGGICGGEVTGELRVDPRDAAYELSLMLHDVDVASLFGGGKKDGRRQPGGSISGHVFLRGRSDQVATRSGGGELRVIGASLLSSRVTASVVQAGRESKRPVGSTVKQAELRFAWDGTLLRFNRVDLLTRNMRLVGEGSWNTASDKIAFTLIGATPDDAPRVFGVTDLLELAGRELVRYHINGTASNPRTRVEALHTLTDPIRKLLKGEG